MGKDVGFTWFPGCWRPVAYGEDKPSADSPGHFTKRQSLKGGALGAGLMILVMMR